jgi:predicted nucleotidyltransferase
MNMRLENLASHFEKEGVMLAYLFGSLAEEEKMSPRPPKDVDLAILTKERPASELFEELADALGTDRLDLVDLRHASPILRYEVMRSGRPIYISDVSIKERYEMDTIHLYRDTEPMRRRQREVLKERMTAWCSEEPS